MPRTAHVSSSQTPEAALLYAIVMALPEKQLNKVRAQLSEWTAFDNIRSLRRYSDQGDHLGVAARKADDTLGEMIKAHRYR